jgi:predicted permease
VTVAIVTVVCASVAGLFLARLLARRRDVAVRLALGASRGRVILQTLAEALLVSVMGLLLGLLFATQGSNFLLSQFPGDRGETVTIDLSLDAHVAWFSVGLVLASTLLVGLLPAWQSSGVSVLPALKAQEGSLTARRSGLRLALITLQVSLCLPLLSSAGLLFRSLNLLGDVDLGTRGDNILLADLDPALNGYDQTRALRFYDQLQERVAALPGVEAVSLGALPPFRSGGVAPGAVFGGRVGVESPLICGANVVAPEYFRTIKIPLLQGREFLPSDRKDSPPVAIINQTLAKALWPGQDALGQWLHIGNTNEPAKLVIGVARDSVYSDLIEDAKQARPFYYLPAAQRSILAQSLHVRTKQQATAFLPGIRGELATLDPNLPLFHITTLKATRDRSLSPQRIAMQVVTFSGVLAIVLAMVGLYAVMRQEVLSRTREIGIRLAVGAQGHEVVSMIVRQGMKLALVGIGLGLIAAFALTRVIRNLLFGVSATDPLTFAVLLLVSCGVGFLACWLPARRASKIDPIVALRYE